MAQQLGEQPVVAIPAPLLVQPLHEQVALGELLEQRVAPAAAGHRIAELSAEPPQHRGGEEEILHGRRLAAEHLVHQVIGGMPVVAREGGDELVAVGGAAERQGRELPLERSLKH